MRLSPKMKARWKEYREFRIDEISQPMFTRGGAAEALRMGEGDPLLLIPGLAGGWRLLMPLARRLARHNEVILVGLRSDGRPAAPGGSERVADHADDVEHLIDQLRLERPTVVGVSFGGAVALDLASRMSGRLGGLAVYGADAWFPLGLGSTIALKALERFPMPTDNPFFNQFFNLLHGAKPESETLARFVVERIWETDQAVMLRRLQSLAEFDIRDRLGRIDAPTLVVAGTCDVIVPPSRQKALAAAIPDAEYAEIDGAGHIGFLTHGPQVVRRLASVCRAEAHVAK